MTQMLKNNGKVFTKTSFLIVLIIVCANVALAGEKLTNRNSKPNDYFSIGIPSNWNDKIYPSEGGTSYAFYDNKGNAIVITVRTPNSLVGLLKSIERNEISRDKLNDMENNFQKKIPLKRNIKLGIETLSNRHSFVQSYTVRQETLGNVSFMKAATYDFLHRNMQYQVALSAGPSATEEGAIITFNNSWAQYFKPILLTLFLY